MVTTDDEELWSRMWSYKDHGKSFERMFGKDRAPGFNWVHESFGSNYRMLEVQAAIGRIQLRRMADWHERRKRNALALAEALAAFPNAVRVPMPGEGMEHAFYRLYAYVRPDRLRSGWDRDRIVEALNARGLPAFQGSCSEVYLEKAFDGTGFAPAERLPVARELGDTSIAFLVHPTLSDEDIALAKSVIDAVFSEASN